MIPPSSKHLEDEETAKKLPIWNHQRQNPRTLGSHLGPRHPWQSRMSGQDLCEHLRWMMQRHCPSKGTNLPAGPVLISLDVESRPHIHRPSIMRTKLPPPQHPGLGGNLERMEVDIRVKERNKRQPRPQIPPQNKAEIQSASLTALTREAEPEDPLYTRGL